MADETTSGRLKMDSEECYDKASEGHYSGKGSGDYEEELKNRMAGHGNFYIDSPRRSLEQRASQLKTELDMVMTALKLMTPEVEKSIQVSSIMRKLDDKSKRY